MSTVTTFTEPQVTGVYRYIHEVILDDLEFEQYAYSIQPENSEAKTEFTFNVHKTERENFNNFIVYGDLGLENAECLPAIEKRTKDEKVDLIWHVGDMCYD